LNAFINPYERRRPYDRSDIEYVDDINAMNEPLIQPNGN
jgi:hypothetical protein